MKKQGKIIFNDKVLDYEKFNLYSFFEEIFDFVKLIVGGFCVLEITKFLLYGWYYDKLLLIFGEYFLEIHYMDSDSFTFSFKTFKRIIEVFEGDLELCDLDPDHELFSNDF